VASVSSCTAEFEVGCPPGKVQTAGGGDLNDACTPIAGAGGAGGQGGAGRPAKAQGAVSPPLPPGAFANHKKPSAKVTHGKRAVRQDNGQ